MFYLPPIACLQKSGMFCKKMIVKKIPSAIANSIYKTVNGRANNNGKNWKWLY